MLDGQELNKLGVAEIKMLGWMCGKTKKHRTTNETNRDLVGAASFEDKMREI